MIKVLIVDDENEILENIYDVLTSAFPQDYQFFKTAVSRQAKQMLEQEQIDILLTDIKMPVFSGFDLCTAAKEHNSDCKVIFLTAYDTFDYAYQALKHQCDDFILKLSPDEELIESFEKISQTIYQQRKTRRLVSEGEKMRGELISENMTDNQHIVFVKQYIDEHWDQDLSLQALAKLVYLHPSYLSKLFRKEYGLTLTEYVNKVRIEQAKQLLINTNMQSKEIAEKVGFESAIYFGRVFKKELNLTPKEFRQQYANIG